MHIDPARKILRHPLQLHALREGWPVYPINVELDLSYRCNLGCTYCAFSYTRRDCDMGLELATRIISQLANRAKAITLTGGGEPTVCPDFEEIVYEIRRHGLSLGMYTNGMRFYPGAFNEMEWLYVSLDAVDERDFQRIKGVDGFAAVVDTVANFAAVKRETVLGLGFLLDGDNFEDVHGMAELGQTLEVDYVQFRPIIGLEDYGWVESALGRLATTDVSIPIYYPTQRFIDLRDGPPRGYEICRASALVPCIGAEGMLWVCPNMRGLRSLGSLADNSFEELWKRRPTQRVGADCREICRNHRLNQTLEYVCSRGPHDNFV